MAVPFNVAPALVTPVAACVKTVGASADVVKDSIDPNAVPDAFWTMAQKKYVVPGSNPVVVI